MVKESLDPEYGDKPENQYGEKWMRLQSTYLNGILDSIMKDIRVDSSDEDGPRMERMSLGDLHICEDGHLIAEIYGGANGGGFRGVESNWPFYFTSFNLSYIIQFSESGSIFSFSHTSTYISNSCNYCNFWF